jgi:hypothetical protein
VTGETWLVIISVFVLGGILKLLSGGCFHSEQNPLLGVVLVPCHKDFCLFDSKVAAGENGSEQRTIDKMEKCHVFLFLVNLWAQVRS